MAENKYYPIRIRNDEEKAILEEFLSLCKANNSDGSTEVRKFMKRYISRYRNPKDSGSDNKTPSKSNDIKDNEKKKSLMQEYLNKIGYEPSYLKKPQKK